MTKAQRLDNQAATPTHPPPKDRAMPPLPQLGDIPLCTATTPWAGAAFMTRHPLPVSFERSLDATSVHGRKGSRWVVTRVRNGTAEEVASWARSEANVALDLIASRFGEFVNLDEPETDNLVWWADYAPRLRATHITSLELPRPHATIRVRRSDGTLAPEPPLSWHPALRFYRLAYLTTDPIERFRYLYLAIENAVSSISAKGSSEGEPAWLKRVFGSLVPTPNWAAVVSSLPHGADPIDVIVDKVYRQTRLPSFHAKHGHTILLPVDPDAMTEAASTCLIAHRLIQMLAQHAGYRISGSAYFHSGFRHMTEKALTSATIQFSADTRPMNAADTSFTDDANPPTVVRPDSVQYEGFLCTIRSVVTAPTLPFARVGLVTPDYPLSATCYEALLQPEGFATLELVMGVRMTQPGS